MTAAQAARIKRVAAELGITDEQEFEKQWNSLTDEDRAGLLGALAPAPRKRAVRTPVPVFPVTVSRADAGC